MNLPGSGVTVDSITSCVTHITSLRAGFVTQVLRDLSQRCTRFLLIASLTKTN